MPLTTADGNSTSRNVMPHGPVSEATCRIGRNRSCVHARLPAMPFAGTELAKYSTTAQNAGSAITALNTVPR
jgi:hypothetical protein